MGAEHKRVTDSITETVSVVIPSYNGVGYLADCLNSLKDQLRKPDEIILVDDGSTDATPSFIKESYPDVQLVTLETNRGFARAVNEGIQRCKGTYIALLNNDTRAEPQWLSELRRTLEENPDVGFCSSKMLYADRPNIINSIGIGFNKNGTAFDVGCGQKDGEAFERSRPIFGACAGAAMYRRTVFDDVGLFDEDFFMWYEDADFSFRAQLSGFRCLYVPGAVVYHIGGGTASSNDRLHIHYCSRNQILMMAKNLPGPLRSRYFRRLAAICLKHSLKTLLRGQTAVTTGYLAALRDLSRFLKKHDAITCDARVSADEISRLMSLDSEDEGFLHGQPAGNI